MHWGDFVIHHLFEWLKTTAKRLKRNVFVLYWACRHPAAPWYAKTAAVCVVAYAFSPIDLIPDFIPVLGYLDDLILVPLGISLTMKLIPENVIADCRAKEEETRRLGKPKNWAAGAVIVLIWLILAAWLVRFLL